MHYILVYILKIRAKRLQNAGETSWKMRAKRLDGQNICNSLQLIFLCPYPRLISLPVSVTLNYTKQHFYVRYLMVLTLFGEIRPYCTLLRSHFCMCILDYRILQYGLTDTEILITDTRTMFVAYLSPKSTLNDNISIEK